MPGFKKLTEVEDPLANALGLSPRPILRDPDVEREKQRKEDYENNPHVKEMRADTKEFEEEFNDPLNLDKKDIVFGYLKPSNPDHTEGRAYSLREVYQMAENGDEAAKQMLKMLGKAGESQGPGHVEYTKTSKLIQADGSTITKLSLIHI